MNKVIIDTNVILVANDKHQDVVDDCKDKCVIFLGAVQRNKVTLLLDKAGEIMQEYRKNLQSENRPYDIGARFWIYIAQNQGRPEIVNFVELDKDSQGNFMDFPNIGKLKKFDASDRKFAALARKTCTPVTNATDSDWVNFYSELKSNGILVNFLCGCDTSAWFLKSEK